MTTKTEKRKCPTCGESCAHEWCGRCEKFLPPEVVSVPADAPLSEAIETAIQASKLSPCRSKRGAVVFDGNRLIAFGHNYKPGIACSGTAECKATCAKTAVHAEQVALLLAGSNANGSDLLHVKTVDGVLVPSGGPSCIECSKLAFAAGIVRVWLYYDTGWTRYGIDEFHRLSIEANRLASSPPPSVAQAREIRAMSERVITQAFVAGQMDAQLKYADELTRPALKLLQAKTYAMAQESMDALIAASSQASDWQPID